MKTVVSVNTGVGGIRTGDWRRLRRALNVPSAPSPCAGSDLNEREPDDLRDVSGTAVDYMKRYASRSGGSFSDEEAVVTSALLGTGPDRLPSARIKIRAEPRETVSHFRVCKFPE